MASNKPGELVSESISYFTGSSVGEQSEERKFFAEKFGSLITKAVNELSKYEIVNVNANYAHDAGTRSLPESDEKPKFGFVLSEPKNVEKGPDKSLAENIRLAEKLGEWYSESNSFFTKLLEHEVVTRDGEADEEIDKNYLGDVLKHYNDVLENLFKVAAQSLNSKFFIKRYSAGPIPQHDLEDYTSKVALINNELTKTKAIDAISGHIYARGKKVTKDVFSGMMMGDNYVSATHPLTGYMTGYA